MGKVIIKMTVGALSYLFKYRPYITVWIVCCIGAGIYESIKDRDIGRLIACALFAFAPLIIKRILLMISRIGGRNRYDDKFFGIAPKGRFINYIAEYLNKSPQEAAKESEERSSLNNDKLPDEDEFKREKLLAETTSQERETDTFERQEIIFSKDTFELIPDCIVTDIETTGLVYNQNSIIEIAAIKVVNGRAIDIYQTLIHRDKPLNNKISSLTGITTEMLRTCGKTLPEAMREYKEFIEELPLVGHNICSFDAKFINEAFSQSGLGALQNRCIDTLKMSYQCLPDADSHKLSELARYVGIIPMGAHRALADCKMTLYLYKEMVNISASTFLEWSIKGKKIDGTETPYPKYVAKLYPEGYCHEYHRKLIESGLLIPADAKIVLNTLKVAELKQILSDYSLPANGVKADLVSRIAENINIDAIDIPIIYVLSQKGIEHKERYKNSEER